MSPDVDMGSLKLRLKMDQVDESVKDLMRVSDEMDNAAEATEEFTETIKTLDEKLDLASQGLAKVAQGFMAISDILEASSKLIKDYGTQLGLTQEQADALALQLEESQKPFLIAAQATMALSDALAIAQWAYKNLSITMLTNPITLVLMAIAAAVTLLFMAWKNNWGGMHDVFDRLWKRLQPAFDAMSRILKKLGFETGTFGEIWDKIWQNIGWLLETVLTPLIDGLVILVEWLEKAIDAWQRFWGAQSGGTMAYPSSPRFSGTSNTYSSTYNTQTSTVYGGVNVYGTENTAEFGMNAFDIYTQRRRGG